MLVTQPISLLRSTKTKQVFGRLDIIFNNAGYGSVGEAEATPDDVAHGQFDVNFWGAINVSRAAIAFFWEVNRPGVGGTLCKFLLTYFMTLDPLLRIIMLGRCFLKCSGDSSTNNGDGYRSKFGMFANKQRTAYVLTYSQHWRVSAKHWPRSLIQHGI